jgi:dihydrofolate reductase
MGLADPQAHDSAGALAPGGPGPPHHHGNGKKVTEGITMRIKARMGISLDGHVAATDGTPSLIKAGGFVPGRSHGYPEFIDGCDTVLMGRQTFLPALGAPQWPWGDMQVFVLTSRPLPAGTPAGVVTSAGGPAGLIQQLRSRGSGGDVHLVGGLDLAPLVSLTIEDRAPGAFQNGA